MNCTYGKAGPVVMHNDIVGHKGRKKKRNKEGQRRQEKGTADRESENDRRCVTSVRRVSDE